MNFSAFSALHHERMKTKDTSTIATALSWLEGPDFIESSERLAGSLISSFPLSLASLSIFMALLLRGGSGEEAFESSGNFFVVSSSASNLNDALAVALRIYAYAFLGMLFSFTTDSQAFVYSLMQQCHLNAKFAYGVLAAWNLLPMIRREYSQIKLALAVRGLKIRPWSMKPLFTALVNAMHWAENVAMAMESKGFDENAERTYYLNLSVRCYDFLWAIFMIAVSMAWIWL